VAYLYRGRAVGGGIQDGEVWLCLQQGDQCRAYDLLVVGHNDPHLGAGVSHRLRRFWDRQACLDEKAAAGGGAGRD
jgi:hypothetical protein